MILFDREDTGSMRLPPLPAEEWDEAVERALSTMLPPERLNPRDAGNALMTFARHPALAKAFLRFNIHLLYSSTLPPRVRELAILRVAHRRDCTYEWTQHVALAKKAGISDDEIAAVRRAGGGSAGDFDEFECAVLTGVDELEEKSQLSDETWAALGKRLDDRQRMDYVFTVGCYALVAMAFNTFGVELEDAAEDWNKTDRER
jgi:AhpD family alkylhydroperoxidase